MTFLPIVERELRRAARRKATHWWRFTAALAAIAITFLLLFTAESFRRPQQVGSVIFMAVSILAFGFCLVAGAFLTADCLCSEKREGTLGLLFLTDLKGYDVVLGKLAATSVVTVYAGLAIVPALGLPLMLGGVTLAEFGRMILVLLVTLFLSLTTGVLASALCRDTRGAMGMTFAVMLGLTAALALLEVAVSGPGVSFGWLLLPSPVLAFIRSTDSGYGLRYGEVQFWWSIGIVVALGLFQLVAASWRLPQIWQQAEPVQSEPKASIPDAPRPPRRQVTEGINPFEWLACRDGGLGGWRALLLTLLLVWFWLMFAVLTTSSRGSHVFFIAAFLVAFGAHALTKILLAMQASRRLSDDQRSGALELLLATPLSTAGILTGQWRALRREFSAILFGLAVVNVAMVAMALVGPKHLDMDGEAGLIFTSFFLGGVFLLGVDFRAIGWVGMWMGVRGLRPHHAVLRTISVVLLPSWLAVFLFVFIGSNVGVSSGTIWFCWFVWIGLSVSVAQVAVARRRRELVHHFRRLAAGDLSRSRGKKSSESL